MIWITYVTSAYPIFIMSAPARMDCAVHLASLAELFLSSVARMAPLCSRVAKAYQVNMYNDSRKHKPKHERRGEHETRTRYSIRAKRCILSSRAKKLDHVECKSITCASWKLVSRTQGYWKKDILDTNLSIDFLSPLDLAGQL